MTRCCFGGGGGGGGGGFYKILNGEAPSQGLLPLTLLYTFVPFDRKGISLL